MSETERWMLLRNEAFPQARPALAPISIVTGWARLNETAPRERPPRANLREEVVPGFVELEVAVPA